MSASKCTTSRLEFTSIGFSGRECERENFNKEMFIKWRDK